MCHARSVGFYRIFYRTGRNGLVIHSTLQHGESRNTRSDGTRRTQQHRPTPLQREFKSPLAHHGLFAKLSRSVRVTPAENGPSVSIGGLLPISRPEDGRIAVS